MVIGFAKYYQTTASQLYLNIIGTSSSVTNPCQPTNATDTAPDYIYVRNKTIKILVNLRNIKFHSHQNRARAQNPIIHLYPSKPL